MRSWLGMMMIVWGWMVKRWHLRQNFNDEYGQSVLAPYIVVLVADHDPERFDLMRSYPGCVLTILVGTTEMAVEVYSLPATPQQGNSIHAAVATKNCRTMTRTSTL